MLYHLGFDVSDAGLGLGSITLADGVNSDISVAFATVTGTDANSASTSLFWMYNGVGGGPTLVDESPDANTALPEWSRDWFGSELQADLRTAASGASWSSPTEIDVTIDNDTGLLTISYNANITITWDTDAGREFCGYSDTAWSGAASHAGDQVPSMIIVPTSLYVSNPTLNYEPGGIASLSVTNTGQAHGLARATSPLHRDWTQQFETKEKTDRLSAVAAHPCSLQKLFEHSRTEFPFVVDDGGFNGTSSGEVFRLREDGASWDPRRASPSNDNQFHIEFETLVQGKFQGAS